MTILAAPNGTQWSEPLTRSYQLNLVQRASWTFLQYLQFISYYCGIREDPLRLPKMLQFVFLIFFKVNASSSILISKKWIILCQPHMIHILPHVWHILSCKIECIWTQVLAAFYIQANVYKHIFTIPQIVSE